MTDPVADDETFVESKAKNRYARWQRALQAPGLPTQTRVLGLQDRSRNRVVEQVIAHADRVTLHACLRLPGRADRTGDTDDWRPYRDLVAPIRPSIIEARRMCG